MCAVDITPVIATERLVLRGAVASDAADLVRLAGDVEVARMLSAMPHPYTPADAEWWLARQAELDWRREAHFVIEHRTFGMVGVLGFKPGAMAPELGYWLGRPYWNRGYMTEAVRAALRWAKRDWRRNVVLAGHFADNAASGEVLVKAGFLYTGSVETRACAARGGEAVATRMMVWLA